MNDNFAAIYETLQRIYQMHRRKYRGNRDTQQMCLMWSINRPPDIIEGTPPFNDIEKAFNISIDDDMALDLYDMNLDDAAKKILEIMTEQ